MTDSWATALLAGWERILRQVTAVGDSNLAVQGEKTTVSSRPRAALEGLFERPDRTEWTDAEAAEKLANAVRAVLDYSDHLNKVDLYAGPAHCIRTLISDALEAK